MNCCVFMKRISLNAIKQWLQLFQVLKKKLDYVLRINRNNLTKMNLIRRDSIEAKCRGLSKWPLVITSEELIEGVNRNKKQT